MTDRSDLIIAGKLNAHLGFWIGPHRAWARASVQREPFHDVHVGSSLPVKGSSVLDPQSTVVTVRAGSRPGLEEYGSFPSDAQPCLVMVQVKGFAAGSDPDDLRRPRRPVAAEEAAGWMRAVIGDDWADYAYVLVHDTTVTTSMACHLFVVFVDCATREPSLAPNDLDWNRLPRSRYGTFAKAEPDPRNVVLVDTLATTGPYADTAGLTPKMYAPYGTWDDVALDSSAATRECLPAFTALADRLVVRRRVHERFRPVSVTLVGTDITVTYRHPIDATTDRTVSIVAPTMTDIERRQTDTRHGLSGDGGSYVKTMSGWANGVTGNWRESIAYGPM